MHFSSYFTVGNKKQAFGFTAEPGDVFNREYFNIEFMNTTKSCEVDARMSFESTYGVVSMQFPKDEYDDKNCNDIASPSSLGYIKKYDGDTFSLEMDLVAMTSAISVNVGILRADHLQQIGKPFDMGPYNDEHLVLMTYYDPRFPRMSTLLCFEFGNATADDDDYDDDFGDDDEGDDNGPRYGSEDFIGKCVLRQAGQLMIPILFPYQEKCQTCPAEMTNETEICNSFDLVVGYVYFEENNLNLTVDLLNKYPNYTDLNDAAFHAYNAEYSNFVFNADNDESSTDDDFTYDTSRNFSFCGDKCSLLTLNAYDEIDQFISPDFYSLTKGFCADSTRNSSFVELANNPPTDLVEEYYRCKNSRSTSFFNSVGLANSNMMLFTPLLLMLFLAPIITAYHKYVVKEEIDTDEYSDDERAKALKVLSSELLRMAQNKESRFPDPDRVIVQLAVDLNSIGSSQENKDISAL